MKKNNHIIIAASCLLFSFLFAKELPSNLNNNRNTSRVAVANGPNTSVLNINQIAYWISADAAYTTGGSPNGVSADYPIFTGGFIYADGMLWGAVVKDSIDADGNPVKKTDTGVRVGGSTYGHGLAAGRVIYDTNNAVIGADDPSTNHVWRVRKDWETADLTVDAANFNGYGSTDLVTDADIAGVRAQYEYDWTNWPAAWGAPYEDVDSSGTYDPLVDIPGYVGADQTMWVVANDVPTKLVGYNSDDGTYESTSTLNTAPTLYGSDPIGIELQVTLWGYALGASDPLGNVIFKQAKMVYTGLPDTPEGAMMDDVFFTQWSDPDLGTYTDDYVGSDVELSFGYVYNGNRLDGVFNSIYNLPVPAGGYDFFQGPPDNKDIDGDLNTTEFLPMTSFTYFGAGSAISDPDQAVFEGSLQFYNLMNGLLPRPEWPNGIPWEDPITGENTQFVLSGDPVTGTGWVDGIQLPPGDRRMVMASGPFMMEKGDTAEVVLGIVGGMGLDQLSSVSVAKFHDKTAQYAYNVEFDLPSAPNSPVASGHGMDGSIALDWGFDQASVDLTEQTVSKGFEFEGYVVYQLPSGNSPLSEAVKLATYDRINDVLAIADESVDLVTGQEIIVPKQAGTDAGVQRYFHTDYDEVRGRPMSNGVTYYFAITAYNYLPNAVNVPFKTLESTATIVAVTPSSMDPGYVYDNAGSSMVTHNGKADGTVSVNIMNPDSVVGGDYEVSFEVQEYYKNSAGEWIASTSGNGRVMDCSESVVSAVSQYAFNSDGVHEGNLDLIISFDMGCGSNWVDGVQFDFSADQLANLGTILSYSITGDGAVCSYGTASGQVGCENLDGTLTNVGGGVSLLFGEAPAVGSTFGAFEGSNEFTITYTPSTNDPVGNFTEFSFSYVIYDDAYDYTEVDGEDVVTVSQLALETKEEIYWKLTNTTTGTVVRKNQTYIGGTDLYGGNSTGGESAQFMSFGNSLAQIPSEGFQIFVDGSYAAPMDFSSVSEAPNQQAAALYGASVYDIASYMQNGWAATAKATDILGAGVTSLDLLQRDIEVRFTGEFDDTPKDSLFYDADYNIVASDAAVDTVLYYSGTIADNGGSHAWLIGANGYSLDIHPEAPADNAGEPFRIWVPFEVWDMEATDENGDIIEGGKQIDIALIDRFQGWNQTAWGAMGYMYNQDDPCCAYSFNPYGRMYTFFLHVPEYTDAGEYGSDPQNVDLAPYYSWNVVWFETQFNQGDKVQFKYDNPIQPGVDTYTFSTVAKKASTNWSLDNVSVYPNPYYGFHELETSRGDKYVSFNNLPPAATIDIYSLGGVFVRSLKHGVGEQSSSGQFAKWDLNNQYGYPVASGVYIARVTSDGKEKMLKIALVQETQVLKYY